MQKKFWHSQAVGIQKCGSISERTSHPVECLPPHVFIVVCSEEDTDGLLLTYHEGISEEITAACCVHNRLCDRGGLPAIIV